MYDLGYLYLPTYRRYKPTIVDRIIDKDVILA